jgi:hypothetical protein
MFGHGPARLFAVLLAVLVVTGCGGGDRENSASPSAAATSSPAPGGEKSIEGFGAEATGGSRVALLGAFRAYLKAIATRHYPIACSYLASSVRHSLSQLVAKGSGRGRCIAGLVGLLSPSAAAIARAQSAGGIAKARVEGGRAFVVFRAPGAKLYQLPMVREGGRWKTSLVAASVLVPSAATLGR